MFKPTLAHLETVVCIARLGTHAAAAARLNTTQPTVSLRVKELEERLGIEVFEKVGRRMMLTVKGRTLVDRYAPLLDEMENVLRSVTDSRAMRGTLRLGCGEIYALTGMPGLLRHARAAMPHVHWEVDVDLTINLTDKLSRAVQDLAIMVSPQDRTLETACLSRLNLTWMADRSLARELRLRRGRDDLGRVPVWTLSRPSLQYELTTACLPDHGAHSPLNTCNHVKALIGTIAGGAGVAMLPDVLVDGNPRYRHLTRIFPDLDPVPIEFHLARRRDTRDSLVLAAYDLIRGQAH